MNVTAMGRAGLTGARGKVARAASRPVSRVTPWSEQHIEAVLGAALLILAAVQFARMLKNVWDAREESSLVGA